MERRTTPSECWRMRYTGMSCYNGSVTPPDLAWRKSTRCGSSACVEVAEHDGRVLIRDSKNPHREPLAFNHAEWRAFQDGIAAGDFSFE